MRTSKSGANRVPGACRRHRGQVIIITLLAILLLAGMVFYVFNLGDQVNRRVSMQNAADSAAIGGATWMARNMNVVAMNNVAQTRLIAMAAVLDSLPLATQMSYEELTEWLRGLDQQLSKPIPDPYLAQGLQLLANRFRGEQQILQPLYDALVTSGYGGSSTDPGPIGQLTYWRLNGAAGDPPHGKLWVGAKALEDFNRAAYETAGLLSQATGARMGGSCIVRDPDASVRPELGSAFIVPVLPEMPAKLGDFMDFKTEVMNGRPVEYVAGTISDQIRRGPYDQLFLWRYPKYDQGKDIPIGMTQGTAGPVRDAGGHGVGGKMVGDTVVGGPQDQMNYQHIPGPQIGWSTYGVYSWALQEMVRSSGLAYFYRINLRDTNFLTMEQTLSTFKLGYIWGDTSIKQIHHPLWICTYPEAKAKAESGAPPVAFTMYYMVQTKSRIPPTDSGYRSPGSFKTNADPAAGKTPQAIWLKGWVDAATWENDPSRKAVRIGDYIWQVDWTYQTTFDESIGLPRQNVPAGQEKWFDVYVREQYVFGGIDIGTNEDIRNPANWSAGDEKPRPYLLDLAKCDYRTDGERYYLSFLGVARMTTTSSFWPQKFSSANPYPNVLAVAEAHVFNNQSWDLWTQDWQTRLRPVSSWDYWANQRIETSPGDLDTVRDYVNADDLAQVKQVLQSFDPAMAQQLKTQ